MGRIDDALEKFRAAVQADMPDLDGGRMHRVTHLSIGAMSHKVSEGRPLSAQVSKHASPFIDELYAEVPDNIWPIRIGLDISDRGDVIVSRISVTGLRHQDMPRNSFAEKYLAWRSLSLTGLDDVAAIFRTIAKLTPPTNRPVQSWSIANNLMGVDHVSHSGVHARSEAETLLKLEWSRYGAEGIEAVISGGGIPERRNDDRQWLVASDLSDLDLDPDGRLPMKLDGMNDLKQYLSSLNDDGPSGP